MPGGRDWVTTTEAAQALGISPRAVLRLIARGTLTAWRWDGRARWKVVLASVRRLAERRLMASKASEMSEMSQSCIRNKNS